MTLHQVNLLIVIILLNTGAIIGGIGFFWRLWDARSFPAGVLISYGIVALMLGSALV